MKNFLYQFFEEIGENPEREGLKKTPERWEEAMRFLTQGYSQSLEDIVGDALYRAESNDLILVKDIACHSLCEHHLLPFVGRMHIGYLPTEKMIGLSKIPRIVELYARRLQTQEHLGQQICDALEKVLKPEGIGVVIEATHFCLLVRGVEEQNAAVTTHHFSGTLKTERKAREEFLRSCYPPTHERGDLH